MDMTRMFAGEGDPRGVLGAGLFRGYLVTLDYAGSRAVLRPGELPPADGAEIFEYASEERLPSLPISIAGMSLSAHLDSGSPAGISLPKTLIEKLPLATKPAEVGRSRTVDAEVSVLGARLDGAMTVGRFRIDGPDLRFSEAPIANVGAEFMKKFVVTLDSKLHRIRLEEPSPAAAPSVPRTGS
jgi:hypothetical protein